MRIFFTRITSLVLTLLFGATLVLPAIPVHAATPTALRVAQSGNGTLVMQPDEVKEITVTFQNLSDSTWKNDGSGYISAYTFGPKYRRSVFDPGTWLSATQVKRIHEASVAPKGTATIAFQLHAPKTEGTYTERFALASEDRAWVNGGEFSFEISVKTAATAEENEAVVVADGLAASLAMQTANKVRLVAGKSVLITAGFKNTGAATWTNFALRTPTVGMASGTFAKAFAHPSWSGQQLAMLENQQIAPGETAYVTFSIAAPQTNGAHAARFQFAANDSAIEGAYVDLDVEVTGGTGESLESEETVEVIDENLIDEPIIRVGVLIIDEETENETVITSYESDYELRDVNGVLIGEIAKGQKISAHYDGTRYVFDRGNGEEYSATALRWVPKTENAVMTVTNFDRRVTRNSTYADNTFRGVMELRYNDTKKRSWLINELPMEYYLRGLIETSDSSPMEYQKAMMTASRTYAFYHWTSGIKHAKEYFHVDAYADQVYRGYGQEARTPNITKGIEASRGQIVTYAGATAITAYYARSDGRTRNWSDIWNGAMPWSVSVAVPCDQGKTMWGHGVGMPASGALCLAKEGVLWDEILKYFYTGIALDQRWE